MRFLSLVASLFIGSLAYADHDHYDGAAHVNQIRANARHAVGTQGHAVHTDRNARITHMSLNGQRHHRIFGARQAWHQAGRRVALATENGTSFVSIVSESEAEEQVAQLGIAFVGFGFDIGNGNFMIFWFPVALVSPVVQINFII